MNTLTSMIGGGADLMGWLAAIAVVLVLALLGLRAWWAYKDLRSTLRRPMPPKRRHSEPGLWL